MSTDLGQEQVGLPWEGPESHLGQFLISSITNSSIQGVHLAGNVVTKHTNNLESIRDLGDAYTISCPGRECSKQLTVALVSSWTLVCTPLS